MFTALLFTSQLLTDVDGVKPWNRFRGDKDSRVLGEHLVLGVEDHYTEGAANVVTQWAAANKFSLDGISPELALTGLLWATVMVALNDAPDYEDIVTAMQARYRDPSAPVPDFRLVVGGSFVVARLIEIFDRPHTDQENRAAFDRRTGGRFA